MLASVLPYLVLIVSFTAVFSGFIWLSLRIRRRGTSASALVGILMVYDEVYRPTAAESCVEIESENDRQAPSVAAGAPKSATSLNTPQDLVTK